MRARWVIGGLLLLGAMLAPAQAKRLDFNLRKVWEGLEGRRPMPIYAEVSNRGPDIAGTVSEMFENSAISVNYPLELPSGSTKRLLVFGSAYQEATFSFETGFARIQSKLELGLAEGVVAYGLISDNPNDADFLRGGINQNSGGGLTIGGCRPDDAPERLSAYRCLDVLILADGTDRLREGQIRAIKDFVISGGSLILVGGTGQSAATDSRFVDLNPLQNLSIRNSASEVGTISELAGTPRAATAVPVGLGKCYNRDYGLGTVAMMTVNPFEEPARKYSSRKQLLLKAVSRYRTAAVNGYAIPTLGVAPSQTGVVTQDPFQIQAPSVSQLSIWLVAYVVVVVPLNFLILRRLKRAELAWVTVPALSILFSLVILRSTVALYKASATTRTCGVVVLSANGERGIAMAKSEMFFPNAASHDLKLVGMEGKYEPRIDSSSYYGSRSDSTPLEVLDNGREFVAPGSETTNLAFREIQYLQITDAFKGIRCTFNGKVIRVQNGTKYTLKNPRLVSFASAQYINQKELRPGEQALIAITPKDFKRPAGELSAILRLVNGMSQPLVVEFGVEGVRIGPGYGSYHPGSSIVALIAPSPIQDVQP